MIPSRTYEKSVRRKNTSKRKSKRQEKNINDTGTVHIISQLFKSIEANGTWLTGVKLTDQHNIGDET